MKVSKTDVAVRTVFVIGLLCIGLLLVNATVRNSRANLAAIQPDRVGMEFLSVPVPADSSL